MVVKGESPRSGAKMPGWNSYGGGVGFFNCGVGEGTSGTLGGQSSLWQRHSLWRGSLLPLERAAVPSFWGCSAAQGEQAPSPQKPRRTGCFQQKSAALALL